MPQLQQFGNLFGKSQKQTTQIPLFFFCFYLELLFQFVPGMTGKDFCLNQKHEQSHENYIIPDMLLWRGRTRYLLHFSEKQESSGIERTNMAITNNTPSRRSFMDRWMPYRRQPDSQWKLKFKCKGERKEEEDTSKTANSPGLSCILQQKMAGLNQLCEPSPPC